jgi:hypothetical protein
MAFSVSKSVFKSLTLQGAVVSLLPLIFSLLGFGLGADGAGLITDFIDPMVQMVGAAMVIYGRIRANQELHL